MSFLGDQTLYDVLDLKPDASPQEIREAYLKIKATFNRDSLALYTLIDSHEREDMLVQLERAYQILSHPDRRREYDRSHGQIGEDPFQQAPPTGPAPSTPARQVVSIDRVPPMDATESSGDLEQLMIAPSTDPGFGNLRQERETRIPSAELSESMPAPPPSETRSDWSGPELKRVRESRRLSLEELSGLTKISKTYLNALEAENFNKLPAPVFVRGFITQVAKALKLPADQVAISYMTRYNTAKTP